MAEFKVGDRIKIKSWDKMVNEYELRNGGTYIKLPCSGFNIDMQELCGELATITNINDKYVFLKFDNEDTLSDISWSYSIYMIEKAEELHSFIKVDAANDYVCSFADILSERINKIEKERNENDMNKVLELYAKRKREEIDKKYNEKVEKDYNDLELVKQYNEIIKDFEIKMDELYNSELNAGESTIHQCYGSSDYKYELKYDIKNSICDIYDEERSKEIKAINDLVEEVEAQLSLSNDLEYQRETLEAYGIIDKKSGKIK